MSEPNEMPRVPRKLIEVALPLDEINTACKRERSIRHGHPCTLHLWWARRPLAAARAVLFSQMVNDPGYQQGGGFKYGIGKTAAAKERQRLFEIMKDLMQWENTDNSEVAVRARAEIVRSWREVCELNKHHPQASELFNPEAIPWVHDPFAGGGTIPLEAQRLGLGTVASDLNPVAVLINKAMTEIPSRFFGQPPVNRKSRSRHELLDKQWHGVNGMAEDVRYYGEWAKERAFERIGQFYPKVCVDDETVSRRPALEAIKGKELTVIAWIWVRTVRSPNPAFSHVAVPLCSTFMLFESKDGCSYVEPEISGDSYRFAVKHGKPLCISETKQGTKLKGSNFRCLMSGVAIDAKYIRAEAQAGRMGERLLAVVAEGGGRRIFLSPNSSMEQLAHSAVSPWKSELRVTTPCHDVDRLPMYGKPTWGDAFMPRQSLALNTFCDLVSEVRQQAMADAISAGHEKDARSFEGGGIGAAAYGDAIATYVGLAVGRCSNYWSSFTPWAKNFIVQTFGRQTIRMVWDHAECNPFSGSTGNWMGAIEWIAKVMEKSLSGRGRSHVLQADAQTQTLSASRIVSTDPPYYDNISYADLSDFFYVWLRRCLSPIFPSLCATMAVPKAEELVAAAHRHGGKRHAESFFLDGMTSAMQQLTSQAHPAFPVTIYYAFKQAETSVEGGTTSTGWVTFLEAVIRAGFSIKGTWPVRTERDQGLKTGTNVLASSVVLVCGRRLSDAAAVSRREFIRELNRVLPDALDEMTRGVEDEKSPVAPVDLSQAIIGPGMAVFTKYSQVLEADGRPMSVRTALQLINRFVAEDDFDNDTQFCLHWFEEHGWNSDAFGGADVLARAKATSVSGLADAGVIKSGGGKVRLLKWTEYPSGWDPKRDFRTPVWEALHHLIRAMKQGGESAAGQVLEGVASKSESARQLAYRLYTLCERKGWAEDARAYNELITSWSAIESAAPKVSQQELF